MSHFLDRLRYFEKNVETFSGGHGVVTREDRSWEDGYRKRWQHDKIVRSTHGVNCTGSCSWKIYVKGGIVTWETQQTDYPRTRPDLPNHEPRGCARGASYSWYLYSANRLKYPLVRGRLLERWRQALAVAKTPVDAWASIVEDPQARRDYQQVRGITILLTSHYMKDIAALCKRVVIIAGGEIVHDGSLEAVIDRFSDYKILTVDFADDRMPSDLARFGEIREIAPPRAKIEVDRHQIAQQARQFGRHRV